jgi:hypothetical protein
MAHSSAAFDSNVRQQACRDVMRTLRIGALDFLLRPCILNRAGDSSMIACIPIADKERAFMN